jgi:uncharacterized protein YecA (UPF0149 family)
MLLEILVLLSTLAFGGWMHKSKLQQQRKALLGRQLQPYQIEKYMETLTEGYLRALGESSAERQASIWALMASSEDALNTQFQEFVLNFSKQNAESTQVSTWPLCMPYAEKIAPQAVFDMRKILSMHAHGIASATDNTAQRSSKDKAFTLMAELLLMQHSCHWFCNSKTVASARMMARHQTSYPQLLAAVSHETRFTYLNLVNR